MKWNEMDKRQIYSGARLDRIAFPLGGLGAGMVCVEGNGALSNMSVRHIPNMGFDRIVYASLCVKRSRGNLARVLEGPVPTWKIVGTRDAHSGCWRQGWGLPRCRQKDFEARFPFAIIRLSDARLGVEVELTAWCPFTPGETDDSCAPVAALEYRFRNRTRRVIDAVFGFHSQNWITASTPGQEVRLLGNDGFVLWQPGSTERPEDEGAFSVACDAPGLVVNPTWFRSGGWDNRTVLWKEIEAGEMVTRPPAGTENSSGGGSLYAPISLAPEEWSPPLRVRLAWYVPCSSLRVHPDDPKPNSGSCCGVKSTEQRETYRPWYATRFSEIAAVDTWWRKHYDDLRERSCRFSDCLRAGTLPNPVMEAVSANLTILKSPTMLRQADGRIWAWEGCCDDQGCCPGSCSHVWNYATALAHLFPDLERGLRVTEFGDNQDERGHQNFRAALPIGPMRDHSFHAAADGQLGGIVKIYRDWRMSGETDWLRTLWPRVRQSLSFCIETWDPNRCGTLVEPHHNTYDIEFWGANGMCTSMYLAALDAAILMAEALGEDDQDWRDLLNKGRRFMEDTLFDGDYFIQKVQWKGLRAADPTTVKSLWGTGYTKEARALLEREGPKYQYGNGCLSDGVIGAWLAKCAGLGDVLDQDKVRSHLLSVYRYNLRHDLRENANPQRPGYAMGKEGGLLLCSWPKGGALTLPFIYSQEVWTGIEYQVASHLVMCGCVDEGMDIVRTVRARYDGLIRNPFDEYECGHWYARALASYALLQSFSGARYDAVTGILHIAPAIPGDFSCFLAMAGGYGLVGVREGSPFFDCWHGQVELRKVDYRPFCGTGMKQCVENTETK